MQTKIDQKIERPLMSHTELHGTIAFEGHTPSRQQLKEELAKAVSAKPELVIVRSIYTNFGRSSASIVAHVYKSEKDISIFVPAYMQARNAPKEVKGEKSATEEKKEETAEAQKEEKKEAPEKKDAPEKKEAPEKKDPPEKKEAPEKKDDSAPKSVKSEKSDGKEEKKS